MKIGKEDRGEVGGDTQCYSYKVSVRWLLEHMTYAPENTSMVTIVAWGVIDNAV